MADPASAIWGYGFGRIDAEQEAKERERAKARRKRWYKEIKFPVVDLERFGFEGSKATIVIKNLDKRPATIFGVRLWKVLKHPIIKSGLLREKILYWERVDRDSHPEIFTLPPSQAMSIKMSLMKPLEEGHNYVLELSMGKYEKHHPDYPELVEVHPLGWAFILTFKDKEFRKTAAMTLEQSGAFWGRVKAKVDEWLKNYPRRGKSILLISSILGILLLPLVAVYLNIWLAFIGFLGLLFALAGWRKAKNGKSASGYGLIGGIFMISTLICLVPGVLAIAGGVMSKRPQID